METKHTPGPWKLNGDNKLSREYSNIIQAKEGSICSLYSMLDGKNNTAKWIEMEANAKLIAAAPELLEALLLIYEDDKINAILLPEMRVKMKNAIKKAAE